MTGPKLTLASSVPDLAALGARTPDDLLGITPGWDAGCGARVIAEDEESTLLRYPLPGTPGDEQGLSGRPRGAGTGHVYLRRYRATLGGGVRARFTHPRSKSLAEREWNLICHLRAHGVGTPEPLAVGALGQGVFARLSFIVTRELAGMLPLEEWARRPGTDAEALASAAHAVGLCLGRMSGAGAWLPRFGVHHIHLSAAGREDGPPACSSTSDLRVERLPGVSVTGFRGGRIFEGPSRERRSVKLSRLYAEVGNLAAVGLNR